METDELDRASAALASGDWETARDLFLAIVADSGPSAEVLDGLGRALWWLKDAPAAIEIRARAFGAYIEEGKSAQAARLAVWLSRELRNLFRTDAAASGWLARAGTAAEKQGDSSVAGWISLARAEAAPRALEAIALCKAALVSARTHRDSNLEVISLARLGFLQVAEGDVDVGINSLDESMAIAAAGEPDDGQSIAEAYCTLMETAELLGDTDRFAQWTVPSMSSRQGMDSDLSIAPAPAWHTETCRHSARHAAAGCTWSPDAWPMRKANSATRSPISRLTGCTHGASIP
jgi:hypothetical protein